MKINSFCQLIKGYNAILGFFIDTGFGESQQLTPLPALTHFIDSYSELDNLLSYWVKKPGGENLLKNCTAKVWK